MEYFWKTQGIGSKVIDDMQYSLYAKRLIRHEKVHQRIIHERHPLINCFIRLFHSQSRQSSSSIINKIGINFVMLKKGLVGFENEQ